MPRWPNCLRMPKRAAGSRTSHTKNRERAMDLKLKGKTALVTGGSEGIGKGIALALAKEGVDVAICARRKEPLEATAAEISKATGRKIVAIPADLRQDKEAKNFIEQAHKALGRIDIMINNAGSAAGGVIEHLTEDDWEKGLQLKFMGYRTGPGLTAQKLILCLPYWPASDSVRFWPAALAAPGQISP